MRDDLFPRTRLLLQARHACQRRLPAASREPLQALARVDMHVARRTFKVAVCLAQDGLERWRIVRFEPPNLFAFRPLQAALERCFGARIHDDISVTVARVLNVVRQVHEPHELIDQISAPGFSLAGHLRQMLSQREFARRIRRHRKEHRFAERAAGFPGGRADGFSVRVTRRHRKKRSEGYDRYCNQCSRTLAHSFIGVD